MMPRTKGVESLWCASCASLSRACGCVAGREGPWNGTRSPTGGAESRDRSTFDDGAQLRMTALAWKARSGAHNSPTQISSPMIDTGYGFRTDRTRPWFLATTCASAFYYRMFIVCFICQSLQPPLANRRIGTGADEVAVVTAVPLDRTRRAVWAGTWASFLMPHWSAGGPARVADPELQRVRSLIIDVMHLC